MAYMYYVTRRNTGFDLFENVFRNILHCNTNTSYNNITTVIVCNCAYLGANIYICVNVYIFA